MITQAVYFGLAISLAAYYINRKISSMKTDGLNFWNGWVGALSLRFLGLIFTAFYLLVSDLQNEASGAEVPFMLTVLSIVVAGLFIDLLLSITRIRKMNNRTDC